ncbi:MAG: efflux RND transporter periplasmic adaptor subunit [Pirellulaceae bacterium]|jgi:putative peptide zinc metalloprotease protein|nr:efflux RND transporter periplasmic adaptor subunit [Pirellulaceae bacterium]
MMSAAGQGLTLRPDIQTTTRLWRGETFWVLKDPARLRYWRLSRREFGLLSLFDGRSSFDDVRSRWAAQFPADRLSDRELRDFAYRMRAEGLLLVDRSGQGELLDGRRRDDRVRRVLLAVSHCLAIRIPLLDPDRLLERIAPRLSWLFSTWFTFLACGLGLFSALAVASDWRRAVEQTPHFGDMFTAERLVLLAAAIILTKSVHELAHAVTLKHFGGECHEAGLMLLVFTPCWYCDVTDAWYVCDRRGRVATAAAGVAAELLMASLAGLLWWASAPGLFNSVCFHVLLVCSVNTVLFNGNPLLRYDGYFAFSNWIDAPNLWSNSRKMLFERVRRWCWADSTIVHRWSWSHAVFGLLSISYRAVLLLVIARFLLTILQPWGVGWLAWLVVGGSLCGCAAPGLRRMLLSARLGQMYRYRPRALAAICLIALAGLLVIPLPRSIRGKAVVRATDQHPVYVSVAGHIAHSLPADSVVRKGDVIAQLTNPELEQEVARLRGDLTSARLRFEQLQATRSFDQTVSSKLPAAKADVRRLESLLNEALGEQRGLTIRAPQSGRLTPPLSQTGRGDDRGELPAWFGAAMDRRNRGAYLEEGELLATVGASERRELSVYLPHFDSNEIRAGSNVTVRTFETPAARIGGSVAEIRLTEATEPHVSLAGELATRERGNNVSLAEKHAELRISLPKSAPPLHVGGRAVARIQAPPQSLLRRLVSWMRRTFARAM